MQFNAIVFTTLIFSYFYPSAWLHFLTKTDIYIRNINTQTIYIYSSVRKFRLKTNFFSRSDKNQLVFVDKNVYRRSMFGICVEGAVDTFYVQKRTRKDPITKRSSKSWTSRHITTEPIGCDDIALHW